MAKLVHAIAFSMWLLLLLLNTTEVHAVPMLLGTDDDEDDALLAIGENVDGIFHYAEN